MPVLLLLTLDGTIPGGDCGSDEASQVEKDVQCDQRMGDRRGIEHLRLAHPLRDESLLSGIGHESIVRRADRVLLRTNGSPLAVQWVKGIKDNNDSTLMMGSMQDLRSGDPGRS